MVCAKAECGQRGAAVERRLRVQHGVGRLQADTGRRVLLPSEHPSEPCCVRDECVLSGCRPPHFRLRFQADRRAHPLGSELWRVQVRGLIGLIC